MCDFACLSPSYQPGVTFAYGTSSSVPSDTYYGFLAFYDSEKQMCWGSIGSGGAPSKTQPIASVTFYQGGLVKGVPEGDIAYVGYMLTTKGGGDCMNISDPMIQIGDLVALSSTPTPASVTIQVPPPPPKPPILPGADTKWIIAAIAGGVLALIVVIGLLWWFWRR